MTFCRMQDVKKTYRIAGQEIEVLKGISLEIQRGEFVAVMGTSGSGKTTLMNLVGCLDVPTSGRYILNDRDISQLTDDQLSLIRGEHIGFVFQSFYLLPYATVLENVLLPTLYTDNHSHEGRARALEILELVGLTERLKFKPAQLSGGQQQRVAIARALINDPELILADEPTGQLDSGTSREIMELIHLMHEKGKTVILVTHDAATADFARRRIQMKDGFIVE
jgi:putative ABC transport system ATP-binding protein